MPEQRSFLQELDETVARGTRQSRLEALWHVTDLLIAGRYDEEEIWLFGEIIQRLSAEIETAARADLSARLATMDRAPSDLVQKLAFDDSIEVAGPVLRQAKSLTTDVLVKNARTKSQQHLLAISQRTTVPREVTDVLVVRGNSQVVNSVTRNSGAAFSQSGFLHLLRRSENDSILTESLGARADIPRHVFQQLIAKASEEIKHRLQSERPDLAELVTATVTDATGALHLKFGPASRDYFTAKRLVGAVFKHGHLTEDKLLEYASARKRDEVVVALSLLCDLPVNMTERALDDAKADLLLIVARAIGLSWPTMTALLFLSASNHRMSSSNLAGKKAEYEKLSFETAKSVLEFYRCRREEALSDQLA
jgi:uncharacterized protein (DUF2336 family)